jgi:hypothetical protein
VTRDEQVERTALCRARRVVDGTVAERALMPDGRTLQRFSQPESGTVGRWAYTRDRFTPPEQWILGQKRANFEVFRTFEDKQKSDTIARGILLTLKILGGIFAVVICYFLWVLVVPLFLCWLCGRAFPNRRHYSTFRR